MSSQNTLVTCADDVEVVRPKGTKVSRQVYRDKSAQGSGVYKAMDENGDIEIIGGPGASVSIYSDQATATDDITTSSTTDVVATGMTLTPPAGTYLVWFSGSGTIDTDQNSPEAVFCSIYSNGTQIPSSEERYASSSNLTAPYPNFPFNCVAKVTVDGNQTIEGRWRVGQADAQGIMYQRNLTILKVA